MYCTEHLFFPEMLFKNGFCQQKCLQNAINFIPVLQNLRNSYTIKRFFLINFIGKADLHILFGQNLPTLSRWFPPDIIGEILTGFYFLSFMYEQELHTR